MIFGAFQRLSIGVQRASERRHFFPTNSAFFRIDLEDGRETLFPARRTDPCTTSRDT